MCWHVYTRASLKTTGADDGTDKFEDWVGHLNTILSRGGGNLNDPIFKSSNARALPVRGAGDVEVSS